jgi:NhaC family Na+:H+ antiporter
MTAPSKKEAHFLLALVPIIILVGLLYLNVVIYEDDATYGPNQIALLVATAIATVIGFSLKYTWDEIQTGIVKSIKSALPAIIILLLIGALAGTWLLSGVVPTMIYYGLKVIHPSIFLFAACLVSAIVAMATGSSWSTIATVGVALLAIGSALGFGSGLVAGAIISGAYFGDKMSPLSDTTNLAPAMAGTDLVTHIRYMALTTVPSILITLVIFLLLGFGSKDASSTADVDLIMNMIDTHFVVSPWLFIVPAIVVFLIVKKVSAIPALFIGVLLGAVGGIIFQPELIESISGVSGNYMEASYVASTNAMFGDISAISAEQMELLSPEEKNIAGLLDAGGMAGMMNTIWLIICAMCFGGVMEACGLLQKITKSIVSIVKSAGSLIATTAATCVFFNITASDQYLAIVVPGRMYADTYRDRGLAPENLSRTLEDSGTVTSVLVPWNTCGAAQSTVLGVATGEYFMYCFFNLISPVMTMIFGFANIRIKRLVATPKVEEK